MLHVAQVLGVALLGCLGMAGVVYGAPLALLLRELRIAERKKR